MSGPLRQATFTLHRTALGCCQTSATLQPVRALVTPLRQQKRYARVLDIDIRRFLQTQPDITEKYKHLLEKKAKSEGLESVDDLKIAYKPKIEQYKRDSLAPPELPGSLTHDGVPPPSPSSSPIDPSSVTSTSPTTQPKTAPPQIPKSSNQKSLDSIIDTSKILLHDAKEIEYIWRARHISDGNSLCAIVPLETYRRIEKAAKRHPMFVLPLPRPDQGIELHFLQWQFSSPTTVNVMFTSLIEYKLRGEFAAPHTTVTHHLDISEEKGIVLLQGSVVENRGVSVEEAKWLLMALQKFYGAEEGVPGAGEEVGRRRELLRQFSEGKQEFDVQMLIKEVETIN
ncbi:hypothetical protein TWF594_003362 [Orbilia oligospora]|uniref:ATP synthase mitochondrial F1 complex assembly factor 1 n=1 Tax=Orbilia oligospora TaxID=2813651 RepID=A0A7C8JQQ7_ORBOL|nr:hypothetical protein TWF703_003105 [Orbilia oligospora]KAF3146577.1 hypothetical protein TWF594_003362 [Orbilia oligospora]